MVSAPVLLAPVVMECFSDVPPRVSLVCANILVLRFCVVENEMPFIIRLSMEFSLIRGFIFPNSCRMWCSVPVGSPFHIQEENCLSIETAFCIYMCNYFPGTYASRPTLIIFVKFDCI